MKATRRLLALSLFVTFTAWPLLSWAWGAGGHRIVGHIAEADLAPEARATVRALTHGKSLADISTWLDEQRNTGALPKASATWHFDDIPVCGTAPAECPDGNCAHAQIEKAVELLRKDGAAAPRELSLRVLVHVVGDIHQPLHAADNADHGGNLVRLDNRPWCVTRDAQKQPRVCNLHEYWDTVLLGRVMQGTPEADYAAALASAYPHADGDSASPNDWIAHTHSIGREIAYGQLPGFACTAPKPVSADATIHRNASPRYDALARLTIERQLARAGHRLGALLNSLFAPAAPAVPGRE